MGNQKKTNAEHKHYCLGSSSHIQRTNRCPAKRAEPVQQWTLQWTCLHLLTSRVVVVVVVLVLFLLLFFWFTFIPLMAIALRCQCAWCIFLAAIAATFTDVIVHRFAFTAFIRTVWRTSRQGTVSVFRPASCRWGRACGRWSTWIPCWTLHRFNLFCWRNLRSVTLVDACLISRNFSQQVAVKNETIERIESKIESYRIYPLQN